jgi:hypothetical protein
MADKQACGLDKRGRRKFDRQCINRRDDYRSDKTSAVDAANKMIGEMEAQKAHLHTAGGLPPTAP